MTSHSKLTGMEKEVLENPVEGARVVNAISEAIEERIRSEIAKIGESLVEMYRYKLWKVDRKFSTNIGSLYGFSQDKMYYIGVASGRIYTKPINDSIVEKIKRLDSLTWKEVGELSDYFTRGADSECDKYDEDREVVFDYGGT